MNQPKTIGANPETSMATVQSDAVANTTGSRGGIANLKPFKPGQSGNPAGKAKAATDVVKLARDGSEKAIKRLVKLIDSEEDRVALAAAVAVLDRAVGKPAQTVAHATKDAKDIPELTTAELIDLVRSRPGSPRVAASTTGDGNTDRVHTLHVAEVPPSSAS